MHKAGRRGGDSIARRRWLKFSLRELNEYFGNLLLLTEWE